MSKSKILSDKDVLKIIRRTIDVEKINQLSISKERLESFFTHVEQLLATRTEKKTNGHLTIYVDGASRGNPGPAGIGVVVVDATGAVIKEVREFLGTTTNNVAEYRGLLRGLDLAINLGAKSILIRTDSELMANQVQGKFKVKSPDLIPLYDLAKEKMARLSSVKIEHVPRDKNRRADILANIAIDSAGRKTW